MRSRPHYNYLIVPGLNDSGPDHWQSIWQRQRQLSRVVQPDWSTPAIETWADMLERQASKSSAPVVILAHSFGCLATVFAAARLQGRIAAALLVAPADPEKFKLRERLPAEPLPFPSLVVASTNDRWTRLASARRWTLRWHSEFFNLGPAGHINAESGFGAWPEGWWLVEAMAARAARAPLNATLPVPVEVPLANAR